MEYKILLDKSDNVREVESEEQIKFVISTIEALDIPFEWDSNAPFSIFDKLKLRKAMSQYNISIIDDMDGGVKIFLENRLIAEWKKASYILKEDISQIDPKKRFFIEMNCNFSSIFEKENDS